MPGSLLGRPPRPFLFLKKASLGSRSLGLRFSLPGGSSLPDLVHLRRLRLPAVHQPAQLYSRAWRLAIPGGSFGCLCLRAFALKGLAALNCQSSRRHLSVWARKVVFLFNARQLGWKGGREPIEQLGQRSRKD